MEVSSRKGGVESRRLPSTASRTQLHPRRHPLPLLWSLHRHSRRRRPLLWRNRCSRQRQHCIPRPHRPSRQCHLAANASSPTTNLLLLSVQSTLTHPLYATAKSRRVPTAPERVLEAIGMVDDFSLNLVSWSTLNVVGIALGENTWAANTCIVPHLCDARDDT